MTRKNNKKNKRENETEAAASTDVESNPADPSAEDGKEAVTVADATGVPSPPEGAAAKTKARAVSESKGGATPINSNKTKAVGFTSSNPKHDEEEVKDKDEEEETEEADPILEPYDSFTMDKRDSLNYQQLEDKVQPQGSRGRFSGKDLMKFIPSTTNKYCLVIYKHPYLQLLHSAFVCGKWVYACASQGGADDY